MDNDIYILVLYPTDWEQHMVIQTKGEISNHMHNPTGNKEKIIIANEPQTHSIFFRGEQSSNNSNQ